MQRINFISLPWQDGRLRALEWASAWKWKLNEAKWVTTYVWRHIPKTTASLLTFSPLSSPRFNLALDFSGKLWFTSCRSDEKAEKLHVSRPLPGLANWISRVTRESCFHADRFLVLLLSASRGFPSRNLNSLSATDRVPFFLSSSFFVISPHKWLMI